MSGDGNSGEKEKGSGLFGRLFGGKKEKDVLDVPLNENDGATDLADQTQGEEASEEISLGDEVADEEVLSTSLGQTQPIVSHDEAQKEPETPQKKGWFSRLTSGLSKSSSKLTEGITSIFTKSKLDDEALQDLEDLLIQSDLGVATAMRITDQLSSSRYDKEISGEEVRQILSNEVETILKPVAQPLVVSSENKPHILLMVGVNGAGKTTSIGKLALKFKTEGRSVMLAAGDTFRAAAVDQLKVWGERTGAGFVSGQIGADASGLVYDALEKARAENTDILMIDTAGRLQNKADLMAELEKIVRVIKKFDPTGPHDVLLTLDATTGQNALNQVEIFQKIAGVTGLIMTKLDGTARGGILVAIAEKYKLPIHAIGVGESIEDMQPFDPSDFAKAIAGVAE
jgi:fused signal recognition particle receptor